MRYYNIPVFVPHKGCPNDCSFCNQKRITGKQQEQKTEDIRREIEQYLLTLEKERYVEIAFFGGSFTGIERERQLELLSMAEEFIKKGEVNGIRLSTRPDYINKEVLDYLKAYGVTAIELGVQSMDENVLKMNNRGHSVAQVKEAAELIKSYGCFSLGLQQMLGLYGADEKSDVESAKKIAELLPETVRIYPTIVLDETKLSALYEAGEYAPYTLEQAVEVGSRAYEIYTQAAIKVIRMGLQATEAINEKGDILGPYHSSYGELVKSRCIRREIEQNVAGKKGKVVLKVNPTFVSKVVGNKKSNIAYFRSKGVELVIQSDKNVKKYELVL